MDANVWWKKNDILDNIYSAKGGYKGKAYHQIDVVLSYKNGHDLMPVIKRTVSIDGGVTVVSYLAADDAIFRPGMDERSSGSATYTYIDDVMSLLDKYQPYIKEISYEVTINTEVSTPGVGSYQPPVYTDITVMRALTLEAEDGITTNPSALNSGTKGIIYVPSQKDFVFTAFSSEKIEVTTTRGNDEAGVRIKDNGNGSYEVTIRGVQYNFGIFIKKLLDTESNTGGGNEGETANTVLTADAVWSSGGVLYVNAAKAGSLSIYNITGQLYKVATVSGSYTLSMPKGVYIVQLNGKAYKVVL
jgi:hypothetical protein